MSIHSAIIADRVLPLRLTRVHFVTLYVIIVAFLPAVIAGASVGLRAVFHFFAADAFVYLSVAEKSHFGFYTFDGVNATNGFHPLWQIFLNAVFELSGLIGAKAQQITVVFWLCVALVAAGSVLTAQAVLRWSGSALAAILTVPGIFGMGMLLCGWSTATTTWRFMNGMETPFSLFFFGLTLFYLSRTGDRPLLTESTVDRHRLFVLSLLSTGIVFSRLDDIFLPAIIVGWLILQRRAAIGVRIRAIAWFCFPIGTLLLAYLIYNYAAVGQPIPISGVSKFSFQAVWINLILLLISFAAVIPNTLFDPSLIDRGYLDFTLLFWRNAQMLGPALLACLALWRMRWVERDPTKPLAIWMRLLLVYVLVKAWYNFLCVPLLHQGHWYYPLSITIINITCAVALARMLAWWGQRYHLVARMAVPAAGFAAVLAMTSFVRTPWEVTSYFDLFERGPGIAAALSDRVADPRIVEADDGILNYALGLPTLSGFLFAIDPASFQKHKQGGFLTEASARGYQLIGSFRYLRKVDPKYMTPEKIPNLLRQRLFSADKWDLDKFNFALAYRDKDTGATFIRFTPKQ